MIKSVLGSVASLLGIARVVKAEKPHIKRLKQPKDWRETVNVLKQSQSLIDSVHIYWSEEKSEFLLSLTFFDEKDDYKIYSFDLPIKDLFFNGKEFYWRCRDRENLLGRRTEELCGILRFINRKNWLFKRRGNLSY